MFTYELLISYLWIESLISDGHQFHQYLQHEQSPVTSIIETKKTRQKEI
jgi:hypothetical protein